MLLFFFFLYNNKLVEIFQATTGHLNFTFLEQALLLMQAEDLSYSLFFLFIQILFLFFNRLLLALSRDVL
jgi:hypothetical protein